MNKDVLQKLIVSFFAFFAVCSKNPPLKSVFFSAASEIPYLYNHLTLLTFPHPHSILMSTSGKGKGANELQMRYLEVPKIKVHVFFGGGV